MGKIVTIKNNKGGVGKSWISLQLGHGISLLEKENGKNYKILLLTSDSQNNILLYSGYSEEIKEGLEELVTKNEQTQIRLRDNLYYIPLLHNNFSKYFREKLRNKLLNLKKEYDFIFIDSVPVLNLDQDFLEVSDNIIIPTTLDAASVQGIVKLMNEIEIQKIKAIIPNMYLKTKTANQWLETLQEATNNTSIYLSAPIKRSQLINELAENGKTVWERKSEAISEFQVIIYNVIEELINE